MQKKLIKVGEDYRVEIDGLQDGPVTARHEDPIPFEHGFTYRGVRQRWGQKVRATVKAFDQKRPARGSGYYPDFKNDGVLVEFTEPVEVGFYGAKTTVKTAVLDTKHIITPWAEYEEAQRARDEATASAIVKYGEEAKAFRPQVEALLNGDHGLEVREDEDGVTISVDGASALIRFEINRADRQEFVTGWSWRKVEIDRELLFKLLGMNAT